MCYIDYNSIFSYDMVFPNPPTIILQYWLHWIIQSSSYFRLSLVMKPYCFFTLPNTSPEAISKLQEKRSWLQSCYQKYYLNNKNVYALFLILFHRISALRISIKIHGIYLCFYRPDDFFFFFFILCTSNDRNLILT